MIEMKFGHGVEDFLNEDGSLYPEPADSLEELLQHYEQTKKDCAVIREKIRQEEAKYKDWDEWDEKDPDGFFRAGMAEQNCDNILDQQEFLIDLKIFHMC